MVIMNKWLKMIDGHGQWSEWIMDGLMIGLIDGYFHGRWDKW